MKGWKERVNKKGEKNEGVKEWRKGRKVYWKRNGVDFTVSCKKVIYFVEAGKK